MEKEMALLMRLIREARLTEAGEVLHGILGSSPEVVAQWLVLARLLGLEPARWDQQVQEALAHCGGAPLLAYRQAVKVLEGARLPVNRRAPLEDFLARTTARRHQEQGADKAMAALERWLDRVRAGKAQWRLAAPERCVARLDALAHGMEPAFPGRVVTRLEQLRQRMAQ